MVDGPLLALLSRLRSLDYDFTAVTPATHAQVLSRQLEGKPTLRDVFGWNRSFDPRDLDPEILALLRAGEALELSGAEARSKLRVARLGGDLFLHSAFPTDEPDSVFFGPDTYRFAKFIEQQIGQIQPPRWIVDMGAGSGVGGIVAARAAGDSRITLVDINSAALRLARINSAAAGVEVETVAGDRMPAGANLVVANPPYMMDGAHRSYRDGGALLGGAVALDWARQAVAALAPGGTLLLYTGVAYRDGEAPLIEELRSFCAEAGVGLTVHELDPDVFGDELSKPAYEEVERIAASGFVISKP